MGTLLTDTSLIVVVTLWLTNVFLDTKITILYQLGKELLTHILSSTILWPPYWKMAAIEVRGHWFSYIRTLKLKTAGLTTKVTLTSWLDDEIWIFIYFLSAILENGRNWGQRSNKGYMFESRHCLLLKIYVLTPIW